MLGGAQACQERWGMRLKAEDHVRAAEKHSDWILKSGEAGGEGKGVLSTKDIWARREQGDWKLRAVRGGRGRTGSGTSVVTLPPNADMAVLATHFIYNHLK